MEICFDGVTKGFGGLKALDSVSLQLSPGEIVCILGENGAGKTTLLRALSGIVAPDSGKLLFDREPFRRENLSLRRKIAFLPDFPPILGDSTPISHAALMLDVYERLTPEMDERVTQLLSDFDLLPVANSKVETLSRGQIYKTALVAMIAIDPELWLLDEPFASGMDPHGINVFRKEARLAIERGHTVIYTTQILELAESFSDKVCVLHKGKLRAFGGVDELRKADGGKQGVLAKLFETLRSEAM